MVGSLIKRARDEKGWTQDELAFEVRRLRPELRVTGVYISRYERGTQSPRLDILEGIAEATGKPLDAFKGSPGGGSEDDEESTLLRAAHELDLAGQYELADTLRLRARRAHMSKRREAVGATR